MPSSASSATSARQSSGGAAALLHPRAVMFEVGVIGVDLLRLGAAPDQPTQAEMQAAATAAAGPSHPAAAPAAPGPLSSHPLHALTASRPSPPPALTIAYQPRPLPQAQLGPLHAALRADIVTAQRAAAAATAGSRSNVLGTSGLTLTSWTRQAAAFFGASRAQAHLYWTTFLSVHRAAYTSAGAAPVPAVAAGVAAVSSASVGPTASSSHSPPLPLLRPPPLRLEVDLQEFMLFLVLQRYRRFSDAWVRARAPEANAAAAAAAAGTIQLMGVAAPSPPPAASTLPVAGVDAQKAFLLQHLRELLMWCKEGTAAPPLGEGGAAQNGAAGCNLTLTAAEFDRLALLLIGVTSLHDQCEVASLAALTPFFNSSNAASTTAVPLDTVADWISSLLNRSAAPTTPAVPTVPAVVPGGYLGLIPHEELRGVRDQSVYFRRARVGEEGATSGGDSAAVSSPSSRSVLQQSQPLSPTAAPASCTERVVSAQSGGFLHVHHCASLAVYATGGGGGGNPDVIGASPWRFVSITHSEGVVLYLGVVTHGIRLANCTDLTVHVALAPGVDGSGTAARIHLSHCQNVTIYSYTPAGVVLLQGRRQQKNKRSELLSPTQRGGIVITSPNGSRSVGTTNAKKPSFTLADLTLSDDKRSGESNGNSNGSGSSSGGGSGAGAASDIVPFSDAFEGAELDSPNNAHIVLAPFNSGYAHLEQDLARVGCTERRTASDTTDSATTTAATAAAAGSLALGVAPSNHWDRFSILEPLDLRSSSFIAASIHSAAGGVTSPTTAATSPSGGSGSSNNAAANSNSIAAGGRRSKATQALQQQGASSASSSPLLQTFPALATASATAPSPSSASSSSAAAASPTSAATSSSAASPSPAAGPPPSDVVSTLLPDSFFPLPVPPFPRPPSDPAAVAVGATAAAPFTQHSFGLPAAYANAIAARHARALRTRTLLDTALHGSAASDGVGAGGGARLLSSQAAHQFQALIQAEFQLWLQMEFSPAYVTNVLRAEQAAGALQQQRTSPVAAQRAKLQQQQQQQQLQAQHITTGTSLLQQQAAYAKTHGVQTVRS